MRMHHHLLVLLLCTLGLCEGARGDLHQRGSKSGGPGSSRRLTSHVEETTIGGEGNGSASLLRLLEEKLLATVKAEVKSQMKDELDALKAELADRMSAVDELQRTVAAQSAELSKLRRTLRSSKIPLSGSDESGDLDESLLEPDENEPESSETIRGTRSLSGQEVTLTAFNQLKATVNALKNRLACVSSSSNAGDLYLVGCNVHVRNGLGSTEQGNGKGNVIVGYNALPSISPLRTGSHNVVIGDAHDWSSHSGMLVGYGHKTADAFASAIGGLGNEANGYGTVVVGGGYNVNDGYYSTIMGGKANTIRIDTQFAVDVGGLDNFLFYDFAVQVGEGGNF